MSIPGIPPEARVLYKKTSILQLYVAESLTFIQKYAIIFKVEAFRLNKGETMSDHFDYEKEAPRAAWFMLIVGIISVGLAMLWSASQARADVTISCPKGTVVMLSAPFFENGVINAIAQPTVTAAVCVDDKSSFVLDIGFKEANPRFESMAAVVSFIKKFYRYGASVPLALKSGS